MSAQRFFVTGALGCIGAWVVRQLLRRGDVPIVFDLGSDDRRLRQLLAPEELAPLVHLRGDITDADAVREALAESGARYVIHLAGLQVPFCRADPLLGARVNVLGTLHVFAAAAALGLPRVVYASSAAVYGPPEDEHAGAPNEGDACEPTTHYGVYKRANEGNARVYWQDAGLASVGIRPLTVYGVGRDQGMTSGPTKAIKAAVLARPFTIPFSGATDMNFAADAAAAFVACAERELAGAHVFNLHGESVDMHAFVDVLASVVPGAHQHVRVAGPALSIPPALDGGALHRAVPGLSTTPLSEGVRRTAERFRALAAAGTLDTSDLDA